jgi:hypothetical protein
MEWTMEKDISPELQKVRRFGRIARGICILIGIYAALGLVLIACNIAFGWSGVFSFGAFGVRGDQFTPLLMIWAAICMAGLLIPGFIAWQRLYALFGNLRDGRIYTQENVRCLRQLALLGLLFPVLGWVLMALSALLAKVGLAPTAVVMNPAALAFTPNSLGVFVWPALLLLASWIMENGRRIQDEAERMRRDAELTI